MTADKDTLWGDGNITDLNCAGEDASAHRLSKRRTGASHCTERPSKGTCRATCGPALPAPSLPAVLLGPPGWERGGMREGGDTCRLSVAHVGAVELPQPVCSVRHAPRGRSIPQPMVSPNSRGPWSIPQHGQHGPRAQVVSKVSVSPDAAASFSMARPGALCELVLGLGTPQVAAPGPGGAPTRHPITDVRVGSGFLCPVVVGLHPAPRVHSCENSSHVFLWSWVFPKPVQVVLEKTTPQRNSESSRSWSEGRGLALRLPKGEHSGTEPCPSKIDLLKP